MNIDALIAAARKRLHKRIDVACAIAAGKAPTFARRSAGQRYRDRAAEAREATIRG